MRHDMEHLGMLLYVMASHKKQSRSLVRNPLEYSRKCHDLPVKHVFKLNPTLETLKNWWASETVTVQTKATAITSSHGRNLLEDLGSECDSDDETASRKKKKAKGKPKKKTYLALVMKRHHRPKNQYRNENCHN